MGTVEPTTPKMKPQLLLIGFLLCYSNFELTLSSPMDRHELQLLEMMRNILGLESQTPITPAESVPCDDSDLGWQEADHSADLTRLFEDESTESTADDCAGADADVLETSGEHCIDFVAPCDEAKQPKPKPKPKPKPRPVLSIDHPCFVRLFYLRTPLLPKDPCQNFTLPVAAPRNRQKAKHCDDRARLLAAARANAAVVPTTTTTTAIAAQNTTTLDTTTTVNSEELTTTVASTTIAQQPTTEDDSTTVESTTTPEPTTTTTTTRATKKPKKQIKRKKSQKNRKHKSPDVPDKPEFQLDPSTQASEVIQVIFTTARPGEMRSRALAENLELDRAPPPTTTTTEAESETETTTEQSTTAGTEEMETETEVELETTTTGMLGMGSMDVLAASDDLATNTDDCMDTAEQDTNLCPQFTSPEDEAAALSHSSRYRKPIKHYVEPILYEGMYAKPRPRIELVQPARRDFYVGNNKIIPRPKPKYRERLPPSIYMNVVRGLKCNDDVADGRSHTMSNPLNNPLSQQININPNQPQRVWTLRRLPPGYKVTATSQQSLVPRPRRPQLYGMSRLEQEPFGPQSEPYLEDGDVERRLSWTRDLLNTSPGIDPCATEHGRRSPGYDYTPAAPAAATHYFT